MKELDYDERYEDYLALVEHCFDVDVWWLELDIESMALQRVDI